MLPTILYRAVAVLTAAVTLSPLATTCLPAQQPSPLTVAQALSAPFASQLVAAPRAPRIAWVLNAEGRRNVWAAEAPAWTPRRLTAFDHDDGQELSSLTISDDGRWVAFVRGGDHDCNWDCLSPTNPTSSPLAPVVSVWVASFEGGGARAIGDGDTPAISPRGDVVVVVRGGQLWVAPLDGSGASRRLFYARGELREPAWSPDGRRLAFVSDRGDHSFVGVYADSSTAIRWLAPTTGRDFMPRWSPDGRRIAFARRPGLSGPPDSILQFAKQPWRIVVADAASGQGRLVWRSPDTIRGNYPRVGGGANLQYGAGGRVAFVSYEDGWPHVYSVSDTGSAPLLLTPGEWWVENARMAPDRRSLILSANTGATPNDIDRRHVVRVSIDRADARVLTPGTGLEYTPVVTGGSTPTMIFLGATATRPALPMVMPTDGGAPRAIAASLLPASFPEAGFVVPRAISYRAPDGLMIRAQLFERTNGQPGARKPAVIFGHGGPERQMLLGFHDREYYARTYAVTQALAARGYVVLVPNYRLGIGYGHDFHRVVDGWSRGASEYQDVRAAAQWLRMLPQVDGTRIGIFGGSYGGFLTAMALSRDPDLFAVGVDISGPSDWTADNASRIGGLAWDYEQGDRAAAADAAWQASPVASVDGWRAPVLFIHGDDDRNTRFSHTIDLVRRLEIRGVPFEELILPDESHHWSVHANAVRVYEATAAFLDRYLKPNAPAGAAAR